jgi:hypothetical protein
MGRLVGKALKHQYEFIYSEAKYTALISGLGAGKTEALVYSVLKDLTLIPKASIGVFAPTVDLFKRIHYPRFQDIFENSGILYRLNKSDGVMDVYMPNGKCQIIFRSMDNFSRIIGFELHKAYLDELDVLSSEKAMEVWIRVLARTRKKFLTPHGVRGINQIGVTTTPEGFGFMYKMWVKDHADNPEYKLIRGRTIDNHHLPADYVESLMRTYPPQLIRAYLLGEFVNLIGENVYTGFERHKSNTNLTIDDFPITNVINLGMDFNVGRMAAAVIMKGEDNYAYQVDEFHHIQDTPAIIQAIYARYPNRLIVVFPDASGRSRKSVDASKSDIRLLKDAGFRINAPKKNPPVRQRVVSLNTMLLNGEGERHLLINTQKCPHTTEMLEKQIYDNNGVPVKDGDEDILDGLGYAIDRLWGLSKPTTNVSRMRFAM